MIEIGGKIYRNLQEQVFENQQNIDDIKDEIQDIEDVQIPAKMSNPMTAGGDLIIGGTAGQPTRLAAGNNGQILSTDGVSVYWDDPAVVEIEGEDVKSTGEISGKVLTTDGSGGASWEDVEVFGEDILSTGAAAGKVLMADGSDGADWSDITATQIKSTGMPSGKVLTTDGSAGSSWQDVPQNFTGSTSGVAVVVSVGTNQLSSLAGSNGQFLTWNNGPVWTTVPNAEDEGV